MPWISDVTPQSTISTVWGNMIRDRVILDFASKAERDASGTKHNGQLCFTADGLPTLWVYFNGTWFPFFTYDAAHFEIGWRDPYAAWGLLAFNVANTDTQTVIVNMTTNNWYQPSGFGFGPLSFTVPGGRAIQIVAKARFDGGSLSAAGSADTKIIRTVPTARELEFQIVGVPSLSTTGGGAANVATLIGFDVPPAGAVSYELQTRKRIPAGSAENMRVQTPLAIAALDMGPVSPTVAPTAEALTWEVGALDEVALDEVAE